MKQLIIKLVYPLLNMLPERWAAKIKIIGCVIVGHWRMQPFLLFDYIGTKSESEALEFFADLDAESLEEIKRLYASADLYVASARRAYFIYNWGVVPLPAGRPSKSETAAARKAFCAVYHLPSRCRRLEPVSFFFHHGLKMLPPAVQSYLRGKDTLDVGAYWGDSTLVFREYSPRRIYAFEPLPKNAAIMMDVLKRNKITEAEVQLEQLGLGEAAGTLMLSKSGQSPDLDSQESIAITITTVDEYAAQHQLCVGMLKADVEGMALALIKGAINTILRDRPVLSIAVYHNAEEFFGVYELLHTVLPDYRFRLRCLSDSVLCESEAVLLAYPSELDATTPPISA